MERTKVTGAGIIGGAIVGGFLLKHPTGALVGAGLGATFADSLVSSESTKKLAEKLCRPAPVGASKDNISKRRGPKF